MAIINLTPVMTSNTAPAPYKISASSTYSSGYEPYYSVSTDTRYWSTKYTITTSWWKIDFGSPKIVNRIELESCDGGEYPYCIGDFVFAGSNDDSNFVELFKVSGLTWTQKQKRLFEFENMTEYRYYRFYNTKNQAYHNIGKVRFYTDESRVVKPKSIIEDAGIYKVFIDGSFEELGNGIPTSEIFKEKGMEDISIILSTIEGEFPYKPIDKLSDKFRILSYCDKESILDLKVSALPKENQLIVPVRDININSVAGVDRVHLETKGENGFVKLIVSGDSGQNWKVFRSGSWNDVQLDKIGIETNGMTSDELSSITREQWDELLINGTVRFSYLIGEDSVDSTYEVDKLEMIVDMKGTWDDTLKSIDYDVEYMNSYLLRVTLKTSGDYKINYADEKSSY